MSENNSSAGVDSQILVAQDDMDFKQQQEHQTELASPAQRAGSTAELSTSQVEAMEEPIDYSAIPTFPADITEKDLNLPEKYFVLKKQNDGFQIPYFLTSEAEVAKIRPPDVVKTWEQRIGELDEKKREDFSTFQEKVKAAQWYEEGKFDDWCCLRYFVARSYDINKAFKMLEKSAEWRKETGADEWECEACQQDPNGHMSQFVGWDKEYRPILFMSMRWGPERKNPLRHMVSAFNHMIKLMPVGVEKWVCMTDFATYSHLRDGKPSMGLSVIRTIQDHYPERLGKMIIINPPLLFWGLYKLFYPAIDPVTRTKVEFIYTEDKPSIYDSFPKLCPRVVRYYLYDTYDRSKHDLPAKPLVWTPNPNGYPKNSEERKQQLKGIKEDEKKAKETAKEDEKRAKEAAKAAEKEAKEAEKKEREAAKRAEKEQRRAVKEGSKRSDASLSN